MNIILGLITIVVVWCKPMTLRTIFLSHPRNPLPYMCSNVYVDVVVVWLFRRYMWSRGEIKVCPMNLFITLRIKPIFTSLRKYTWNDVIHKKSNNRIYRFVLWLHFEKNIDNLFKRQTQICLCFIFNKYLQVNNLLLSQI